MSPNGLLETLYIINVPSKNDTESIILKYVNDFLSETQTGLRGFEIYCSHSFENWYSWLSSLTHNPEFFLIWEFIFLSNPTIRSTFGNN